VVGATFTAVKETLDTTRMSSPLCNRKRHKKSQPKTSRPALKHQARHTSPAAQIIANRIANGGLEGMKQNLIQIMIDSAQLAEVPEFNDLYLDDEKTTQVTDHWLN
jgi:hypothetical protein